MNDFRVQDLLYKGDVSDIWHGIHLNSNRDVFVVHVNKTNPMLDYSRFLELEPTVGEINHQHILKYLKVMQNESTIGIIMEHPQGCSLREYLTRRPDRRLSESEARVYFRQMLSAVEYLHSLALVHRNLNLQSIFIDKNNSIKVGDFLICPKIGSIYKHHPSSSSYHFFAPEIWQDDDKAVDSSADIWSLGVILFVMTCGNYPFNGNTEFEIFASVKCGHFSIPNFLSDECASLIKSLLPKNAKRPDISTIKAHPWMTLASLPNTAPSFTPTPTSQIPRSSLRMSLGTIPEAVEVPGMSSFLPSRFADLNINSPKLNNNFGPAMSIDEATAALDITSPQDEEDKRNRRKRNITSSTDPVHTLIANYFKAKEQGNGSPHVSSYLPHPTTPPPMGTVDASGKPPHKRRNSADSVLKDDDVYRLLALNEGSRSSPVTPLGTTPTTPTTPSTPSPPSMNFDSVKRNQPKPSSPSRRASAARRRRSLEVSLPSSLNAIPEYENISLFQPMGNSRVKVESPPPVPTARPTHSRSLSANELLQQSDIAHQRNIQRFREEQLQALKEEEKKVEEQQQESLEELLHDFGNLEEMFNFPFETLSQELREPLEDEELRRDFEQFDGAAFSSVLTTPFETDDLDWVASVIGNNKQ